MQENDVWSWKKKANAPDFGHSISGTERLPNVLSNLINHSFAPCDFKWRVEAEIFGESFRRAFFRRASCKMRVVSPKTLNRYVSLLRGLAKMKLFCIVNKFLDYIVDCQCYGWPNDPPSRIHSLIHCLVKHFRAITLTPQCLSFIRSLFFHQTTCKVFQKSLS